jgi:tetratricopeptide (TPR) repeat protein
MAEDDEKLGHLDAMMGDAVEASRTTIALLTDQPNNRSRLYLNAQSEYWIGRAHELRSEWESAADRYAAYSNAARTLIRLEPSNPVFLAEMGYSLVNLGQIQMDGLKDSQAAMGSFAEGAEWLEKARATRPRDKHLLLELANAYGWIADSHYDRKAWSTSVDWRLRQYSLLRLLAESSSSSGDQQLAFRLATVHRALASSYFQLRKPELVRRHFDVALVLFEMLSRHDPANMEWLLPKAFLECEAVFHHYAAPAGRSEAALRSALHEDVIRLDPDRHPAAKPAARCEKALPDRPERRRRHDAI